MGIIAVAGGTGQVGRGVVQRLVNHGHKVFVLSRKESEPKEGYTTIAADYNDVNAVTSILQDKNVGTLICAIGVLNEKANISQLSLIQAASQSRCTRRFVIGSFDMEYRREHIETFPLAKYGFKAIEALKKTDLEYTRIANGWFLDYYGMPHWETSLHPWINILSMEHRWAAMPGDGSSKATFITTQDLGRFIGYLMDLPKWEKVTRIEGNEMRFDELLALAEEVRGSKFEVAHDNLEKLDSSKISFANRFPAIGLGSAEEDEAFFARVHYLAGSGYFYIKPDKTNLNYQVPLVRLTTCEEVMRASWQGRE